MDYESATCAECGAELDELTDLARAERTPCPTCGPTRRVVTGAAVGHARARAMARGTLIRAWDSGSLTLFGVLYAILVMQASSWRWSAPAIRGSGGRSTPSRAFACSPSRYSSSPRP